MTIPIALAITSAICLAWFFISALKKVAVDEDDEDDFSGLDMHP